VIAPLRRNTAPQGVANVETCTDHHQGFHQHLDKSHIEIVLHQHIGNHATRLKEHGIATVELYDAMSHCPLRLPQKSHHATPIYAPSPSSSRDTSHGTGYPKSSSLSSQIAGLTSTKKPHMAIETHRSLTQSVFAIARSQHAHESR
jgi:hypothetical protein